MNVTNNFLAVSLVIQRLLKPCCLVAGLVLLTPAAMAFPFEVEERLNGTLINIQTFDLGENMAAVSLTNSSEQAVRCKLRFKAGPQTRARSALVAPGQQANLTASFSNKVIRMRVLVDCKPVGASKR